MNKYSYIFLSQLIAATKGNKQLFISKNIKASHELISIFKSLNIIKKVTEHTNKIIRTMPKTYRKSYIVVWLETSNSQKANIKHNTKPTASSLVNNGWAFNKIIINKSSVYDRNVMSFKKLIDIKPFKNTVYIMQTSRGIITS